MTSLKLSRHAIKRMQQRSLRREEIEIIQSLGTEVEGGYLVLKRDFQEYERNQKKLIERARKLVGKRVVMDGNVMVTAYHANQSKERCLLRNAEARNIVK